MLLFVLLPAAGGYDVCSTVIQMLFFPFALMSHRYQTPTFSSWIVLLT